MPTLQPAELWRETAATTTTARRCCGSATATTATCSTARPTRRWSPTCSAIAQKLSRPAADPLPYSVEVPRRGAAPLRRDARPRVPDEGRLLLRPRRRRRRGTAIEMMLAYMRTFQRMGLNAIPMEADTGPIGGDLSHEFIILAPTGESEVYYDATVRGDRLAPRRLNPTDVPATAGILRADDLDYAATDEKHDAARWAEVGRGAPARRRAASRSATSSISAPNTPRRWADGRRPRRQRRCIRRWAATASACPAWSARSSRPATTRPASSGRTRRPVQGGDPEPASRRRGLRRDCEDALRQLGGNAPLR